MYAVTADNKNEELLIDASETLASAKNIAQDCASLFGAWDCLLPGPSARAAHVIAAFAIAPRVIRDCSIF
jgi:hypothetical protein